MPPGKLPERVVKLFRNGRNQAVRVPREFELPGSEAIMRKSAVIASEAKQSRAKEPHLIEIASSAFGLLAMTLRKKNAANLWFILSAAISTFAKTYADLRQ